MTDWEQVARTLAADVDWCDPQRMEIIRSFVAGETDVSRAFDAFSLCPKPWDTALWRQIRENRIGRACEECGDDAEPLVLQHTKQPPRWEHLRRTVGREMWQEYNATLPPLPKVPQGFMDACPYCGYGVRYRKRAQEWMCCREGCKRTFAEPVKKEKRWITDHDAFKARRNAWYEEYRDEIARRAFLVQVAFSHEYWSMRHTKTLCRKCAAREDWRHLPNA